MKKVLTWSITLCAALCLPALTLANNKVQVSKAERNDVSRPLREVRPLQTPKTRTWKNPMNFVERSAPAGQKDPVLQESSSPNVAITGGLDFEGVGEGLPGFNVNVAPPDTTGDVGATQYVQWVNTHFAVFDKTSGLMTYGPAAGNTFWAGFGGPCETRNDGDPLVQYDQMANRWVMSQFALPSGGPYYQCVAVSATSDATGAYYRYAFSYGNNLNDYGKIGIWPDGYYITYNMFLNGSSYNGAWMCALERDKMLAGAPASEVRQQCFQTSTSYGSLLPSDMDGPTQPPAGSPNYILSDGSNSLLLWRFKVDWANTANTTVTGPSGVGVASFSHPCPTTSRGACVPQPDTAQKLETLADRLMYRLAYRNYGGHESLVVTQAVNAGSTRKTVKTGIRWYELRNASGQTLGSAAPVVHQQGTYSPDSHWRWMSSAAMDKVGNLAVGYSVASGTLKPSIRFAARAAADPLGTLGSETTLKAGTGSQLQNLARWGDYATLSVDPVDDCTMWFTTEYLAANGTWNWHTRINSFKLQGCQ